MGKSADSKSHMNQQQKKPLKLLNLPGQPYLFDVFLNLLSLTLRFNMLTEVHRVWDVVRVFLFFLLFLWALHDLTIEWICYEVHSREDWVTTPWSSRSAKYKITTIIEVVTHTVNQVSHKCIMIWGGLSIGLSRHMPRGPYTFGGPSKRQMEKKRPELYYLKYYQNTYFFYHNK